MATANVRMLIAEDAAARVDELGMRREFEQMLEHAKQVVPDLLALRVTLEYNPECPHEEPGIVIRAHREEPRGDPTADKTDLEYGLWRVDTFPPQVRMHFSFLSTFGDPDGW